MPTDASPAIEATDAAPMLHLDPNSSSFSKQKADMDALRAGEARENKSDGLPKLTIGDQSKAATEQGEGSGKRDVLIAGLKDCTVQGKDGERKSYYDKNGDLMAWESASGKLMVIDWEGNNLVKVYGPDKVLSYDASRSLADGQWVWRKNSGEEVKDKTWNGAFIMTNDQGVIVEKFLGQVTKDLLRNPEAAALVDMPIVAQNLATTIEELAQGNSKGGARLIAEELLTKSPQQIEALFNAYKQQTGKDLAEQLNILAANGSIPQPMNAYLQKIISTSHEARSPQTVVDLANMALSVDDGKWYLFSSFEDKVALLQATIGGDSAENKAARDLFMQQGGEKRLSDVFGDGAEYNRAKDVLTEGRVNPATEIERDNKQWRPWVNDENIDNYIASMSNEQRELYKRGRALTSAGTAPTNEGDVKAVEFFNKLDKSMKDASYYANGYMDRFQNDTPQNELAYMRWTSMLESGQRDTLIGRISRSKNSEEGVRDALLNMSEADFNRIKNDREYEKQVRRAIDGAFSNSNPYPASRYGCHNILNDIELKQNIKEANSLNLNQLKSAIDQNTHYGDRVVDFLSKADQKTINQIAADKDVYKGLRGQILYATDAGSGERAMALYRLDMYRSGKPADAVDNINLRVLDMKISRKSDMSLINAVSQAIAENPNLGQTLKTDPRGATTVDALRRAVRSTEIADRILSGGKMTADELYKMTTSYPVNAKTGVVDTDRPNTDSREFLEGLSSTNGTGLKTNGLDKDSTTIAQYISAQGGERTEDTLRKLILSGDIKAAQIEELTAKMTSGQRHALEQDYQRKYGGNLQADLRARAESEVDKEAIRQQFMERASTYSGAASNKLRIADRSTNVSDTGRAIINVLNGGDVIGATNQQAAVLANYTDSMNKAMQKATPEQKAKIDQAMTNLTQAVSTSESGKKEAVAKVERAAMAVTMAIGAAIPFVGPTMEAIGIGSCIAIGVGEVASRRAIEGGKYDGKKAVADGISISLNLAMNLAPLAAARVLRAPGAAALLKEGVSERQFAADFEQVIRESAKHPEQLEARVHTLLAANARDGQQAVLAGKIKDQLEELFHKYISPRKYEKAEQELVIGNTRLDPSTKRITIGRNPDLDVPLTTDTASRLHGEIVMTEKGPLFRNLNASNGTLINGNPVPSEGVLLKVNDRLKMGSDELTFHGMQNKIYEFKVKPGDVDITTLESPLNQSNRFQDGNSINKRLEQGFQTTSQDRPVKINFNTPNQPKGVVFDVFDRAGDRELQATFQEAHDKFDKLKGDPRALATELTKFSKQKMHPAGWSEEKLDEVYDKFLDDNTGKKILLGNYITMAKTGTGGGVCSQQAFLFKVLADDFGLESSMVQAYVKDPGEIVQAGTRSNHVLNEVVLDGDRYIFDPRNQIFGVDPNNLEGIIPATEQIDNMNSRTWKFDKLNLMPGDKVSYKGNPDWVVSSHTPMKPNHVVLLHDGKLPLAVDEVMRLNSGRQLVKGEMYQISVKGKLALGWKYEGLNSDGTALFTKVKGLAKEVSIDELVREMKPKFNPIIPPGMPHYRPGEVLKPAASQSKKIEVVEQAKPVELVQPAKPVEIVEQVEKVLVPYESGKYRPGSQVSYDGNDFTLVKYDNSTGRPIIFNPHRGDGWALSAMPVSSEQFKLYRPLTINGETFYIGPNSGSVYKEFPIPGHKGEIRLTENYNYVIVKDVENLKVATTR